MGTAFDTFNQYSDTAIEGQLQDRELADVVSLVALNSDIGYGLGVYQASYQEAELPTGAEVSSGITVRETLHDNPSGSNPTPIYEEGETMSVLRVGRIWVNTVDGAAPGDDVYVVPSTGALTNSSTNNIQLPNASFISTASAGELALVQLNGA
jgi:hypothetical protein